MEAHGRGEADAMEAHAVDNAMEPLARDRAALISSKTYMNHNGAWGIKELECCDGGRLAGVVRARPRRDGRGFLLSVPCCSCRV